VDIATLEDYRRWIDGYDTGIRYMDDHIGQILDALHRKGVLDETAIIVSADHGESQGELNIYGDHQTADHTCCRVPLLIAWPGIPGGRVDRALHYQVDMAATIVELTGGRVPELWDGRSFAPAFRDGVEAGRDYLVVSQMAWSCQRGIRWGDWMALRTYHDGLKDLAPEMLFNLAEDPHETRNLATERPEVMDHGLALLERWHTEMLLSSPEPVDPLWTVLREGGPFHTRGRLHAYCAYLRETGRAHHADALLARHAE
jgi:arylsulfatase A-like enzyme